MKYVIDDIWSTAAYWPLAFGIGILFMAAYWNARKILGYSVAMDKGAALTFLWVSFTILIVEVTIFSRPSGSRNSGIDWSFLYNPSGSFILTLYSLENVLLFTPYGILLAATFRKKMTLLKCMFICAVFSVGIETVQYITGRGYCQLEDVILNTFGGVCGYVICYCFTRLIRKGTSYLQKTERNQEK